uniref:Uncharacterized protein n=1 Tax=Trichogramma kaykai TaxID=54128 RepID=A0ABD2WBU2_9HYME
MTVYLLIEGQQACSVRPSESAESLFFFPCQWLLRHCCCCCNVKDNHIYARFQRTVTVPVRPCHLSSSCDTRHIRYARAVETEVYEGPTMQNLSGMKFLPLLGVCDAQSGKNVHRMPRLLLHCCLAAVK